MNDHTYRTLSRYANSDLSELAGLLNPAKRMRASAETLAFGTAFHTLILEPQKFDANPIHIGDLATLTEMHNSILADRELHWLLAGGPVEQVRTWIDPATGLPLKCRIDSAPTFKHIVDLKTTACKSLSAFIDSLTQYDYDRQAAFYLSSDPAARFFEFVGVQKQGPYSVFRVPYHIGSEFIRGGQRKMAYLLGVTLQEAKSEQGWRPASWSRKEISETP